MLWDDGLYTKLLTSPTWNTRLYTGRAYERGIWLYYNRARYYNPTLGRFISTDPIGIADDVNLYAYVGNNPVIYVDLFGKEKQLLQDIYDGNSFVVELVARNLNGFPYWAWVHTYINIRSFWGNWYFNQIALWGQLNDGWLLQWFFDFDWDEITTYDFFSKWGFKSSIILDTPNWFTDAQFVRNIHTEYKRYNDDLLAYNGLSVKSDYFESGNCNNYATSLLYNASNYDSKIVSQISNFNPQWFNPGLWEVLYTWDYNIPKEVNSCSQ
jgi:RHS repeat-associated protein